MDELEDDDLGEDYDPRLLFLYQYLSRTVKFKVDKWHKMMATEDYKAMVMNFINRPTEEKLIITLTSAGVLQPSTNFPVSSKSKSSYFIRRRPEPLTAANVRQLLMFGDISPKPIDELAVLIEEVYFPMLTSPVNTESWPRPLVEDISRRVTELKDVIYKVKGQVYGQTILTMPPNVNLINKEEEKILRG
ncbi:hypothetical protein AAG570_013761 [Ranatra chinensis]|uniref:Uncharacterized protein n=1 Tax=Ranatra chinensis TaxID=642074 RepID=A0ABD0YRV5_9HEMI